MREFHFLLLPRFSFMGFASAIEPLRVANRFRPGSYRWSILSLDGGPVVASNEMSLNVDGKFSGASYTDAATDVLFVVAGFNPLDHVNAELSAWLRQLDRQGVALGAIDTGAFLLAEAGLLQNHKVTVHWEALAAFKERYPKLAVSSELFEIAGKRLSCAGGTAGIDMTLALIAKDHGREMTATISEQFVLGRIRSQSDQQRLELTTRYGVHNASVIQGIRLMQSNSGKMPLQRLRKRSLEQRKHRSPSLRRQRKEQKTQTERKLKVAQQLLDLQSRKTSRHQWLASRRPKTSA